MMKCDGMLNPPGVETVHEGISYAPLGEQDFGALADMITGMRSYSSDAYKLRDTSGEYYRWMYSRNPAGKALVFGAKDDGQLVASFAMAPKRIRIGSRIEVCGKTMEMFTRPEWQGRGIVKRLVRMTLEAASRAGIRMWYVTPSVDSHSIFVERWGYRHSFKIHNVMKVLKPSALLAATIKSPLLGRVIGVPLDAAMTTAGWFRGSGTGFDVSETDSLGPDADALWEKCMRRERRVALVRDAAYLNWRYVDNPDTYTILQFRRGDELRGILVLKHSRRRGLEVGEIVDYVCPDGETAVLEAMLRHGINRLRDEDCTFVQAWAVEDSEQERVMKRAGLSLKRKEVVVLLNPDNPYPEAHDGQSWMLAQGDSNDI
jgi:GNAT superfamily N-acetyltransferase